MSELDEVSEGFRRLVGPLVRSAGLKGLKMTVAMSCTTGEDLEFRVVTDMLKTGNLSKRESLVTGALLCNVCVGDGQKIESI